MECHITEYGVTDFVVGHYGAFDRLAARAVKTAKERHPAVARTLLLPYHPADRPIPTPAGFDSTFYPPNMEKVPVKFAISKANRWMVEHSGFLISYPVGAANSRELTEYALRREKQGLLRVTILAK